MGKEDATPITEPDKTEAGSKETTNPPAQKEPPAKTEPGDDSEDKDLTPAQYKDALQKARADAAKQRAEKNELAKKNTLYESEKEEAERKRLEEQGEHKKIADKALKDLETERESNKKFRINSEIKVAAIAAGIIDPKVAQLIPTDKIGINAAGEIEGVVEAVAIFKKESPNLFGDPKKETTVLSTGSEKLDPPMGTPDPTARRKEVMSMKKEDYEAAKKASINS